MKKIISVLILFIICLKIIAQKNEVSKILNKVIINFNQSFNCYCFVSRNINSYKSSNLSIRHYLNKDTLQQYLNNELFKKINIDTVFSENDFVEMLSFINLFKEKQIFSKKQLIQKFLMFVIVAINPLILMAAIF